MKAATTITVGQTKRWNVIGVLFLRQLRTKVCCTRQCYIKDNCRRNHPHWDSNKNNKA